MPLVHGFLHHGFRRKTFATPRSLEDGYTSCTYSFLPLHTKTDNTTDDGISYLSLGDAQKEAALLLEQAKALRQEADSIRQRIDLDAQQKKQRETERIDKWIRDILLASEGTGDGTEVLYSVEQVARLLSDKRFSEDHIMSMFRRLSESEKCTRSNCSPLVELLVEASGRMDCVEREEQANKRWSGKVERKLRRRLFARDWGIELDDLDETERGGRDY
jgi:hypothetical protein